MAAAVLSSRSSRHVSGAQTNENARGLWGPLALILKNLAVNQRSTSPALPYGSAFDSRLQFPRAALLRSLHPTCVDCRFLRLCRASSPSTCVSSGSARLILRANLRLSVASSAGSIIVLRSPLSLRASFRDHPSDFSFRLLNNPFVRFCIPIELQLAPSPNRSASRSALSPACTAD